MCEFLYGIELRRWKEIKAARYRRDFAAQRGVNEAHIRRDL
jgi:hypothetical protein